MAIIAAVISVIPKTAIEYTHNITIKLSKEKIYVFETGATASSNSAWAVIQDWCVLLAKEHPQEAVNVFRGLLNALPSDREMSSWGEKFIKGLEGSGREPSFKLAKIGAINAWVSRSHQHYLSLAASVVLHTEVIRLLKEIYGGSYNRRSQQVVEMQLNALASRMHNNNLPVGPHLGDLANIAREEANHRLANRCFELMAEASRDKELFFSAIAPVLEFPGAPYSHVAQDTVQLVTVLDRTFTVSLQKAVSIGSLAAVRLLLDRGDDPTVTNQGGRTLLHQAARKGYEAIAQLLCTHDKSLLSCVDEDGYLPLHVAAENGYETLLPLLLGPEKEHLSTQVQRQLALGQPHDRFDPDEKPSYSDERSSYSDERPSYSDERRFHFDAFDFDERRLYSGARSFRSYEKPSHSDEYDSDERRFHGRQFHSDESPIILELESSGAKNGTALHLASANGHEGVVTSLLHCKAIADERDKMGWTALHKSCARWQYGVANILLRHGVDVNSKTDEGSTALVLATKTGHTALVALLLQHHALIGSEGTDKSALSCAVEVGDLETATLLLEHGADIQADPNTSQAPLHLAAKKGHLPIVMLLIEKNPNLAVQDQGALLSAAESGHVDVVKLLLQYGANVDTKDDVGNTALQFATERKNLDVMKLLLHYGATVDARDDRGKTALHFATEGKNLDAMKLLLENGADIESQGEDGTALHLAANIASEKVAQLLLDNGANVGAKTTQGSWTALHIAARGGNEKVVRVLLNSPGVRPVFSERAGEGLEALTPEKWAVRSMHYSIASLIRDAAKS